MIRFCVLPVVLILGCSSPKEAKTPFFVNENNHGVEVFENDTDTTVYSLTAVKRTAKTGNYRVAIAATAVNGFEIGKSYNVIASATVGGVASKAVIASFMIENIIYKLKKKLL